MTDGEADEYDEGLEPARFDGLTLLRDRSAIRDGERRLGIEFPDVEVVDEETTTLVFVASVKICVPPERSLTHVQVIVTWDGHCLAVDGEPVAMPVGGACDDRGRPYRREVPIEVPFYADRMVYSVSAVVDGLLWATVEFQAVRAAVRVLV